METSYTRLMVRLCNTDLRNTTKGDSRLLENKSRSSDYDAGQEGEKVLKGGSRNNEDRMFV